MAQQVAVTAAPVGMTTSLEQQQSSVQQQLAQQQSLVAGRTTAALPACSLLETS